MSNTYSHHPDCGCDQCLPGSLYLPFGSGRFDEVYKINESDLTPKTCTHNWQQYQGFTDNYEYCTFCDKKRGLDEKA